MELETAEEKLERIHNESVGIAKMLGWSYMKWNPIPEELEEFYVQYKRYGSYMFDTNAEWTIYTLNEIKKLGGVWRVMQEKNDNSTETQIYFNTQMDDMLCFRGVSENYNTSMYKAVVDFSEWYNYTYKK